MTAVAMALALVAALGVGYRLGRRAGARTPTWRQRTRPVALGRQMLILGALLASHRGERWVQRKLRRCSEFVTTHCDLLRWSR